MAESIRAVTCPRCKRDFPIRVVDAVDPVEEEILSATHAMNFAEEYMAWVFSAIRDEMIEMETSRAAWNEHLNFLSEYWESLRSKVRGLVTKIEPPALKVDRVEPETKKGDVK